MRVDITTAAAIGEVKPGTIRQWVARGHINCYPDGYETVEILHWVNTVRDNKMLEVRMHKPTETGDS